MKLKKIRNSNKGKFISEETRIKMSNAQKMNKNHPKGWHHSEETKRKLSELGKTRKLSEYQKQKLIESNTGRVPSEETRQKISRANKGKIVPKEIGEKISKSKKGKHIGKDNANSKSVICLETNKIFYAMMDVKRIYNIDNSSIAKCCKGKIKFAGKLENGTKLHWMYYEDYKKTK